MCNPNRPINEFWVELILCTHQCISRRKVVCGQLCSILKPHRATVINMVAEVSVGAGEYSQLFLWVTNVLQAYCHPCPIRLRYSEVFAGVCIVSSTVAHHLPIAILAYTRSTSGVLEIRLLHVLIQPSHLLQTDWMLGIRRLLNSPLPCVVGQSHQCIRLLPA